LNQRIWRRLEFQLLLDRLDIFGAGCSKTTALLGKGRRDFLLRDGGPAQATQGRILAGGWPFSPQGLAILSSLTAIVFCGSIARTDTTLCPQGGG
jgi:hypothetical protein